MADKSKIIRQLLESGEDNIASVLNKLRGKTPPPAKIVQEAEELLPTVRANTLPDIAETLPTKGIRTVENEFVDAALPKVANMADDIVPPANKLPNMAIPALAAGAGGAMLAGALTNDTGEPDTAVPSTILQNANRQIPVPQTSETKKQEVKKTSSSSQPSEVQKAFEDRGLTATLPTDDFEARLQEAREKDQERELLFGLLKAAQMGGSALASSKADTSFADKELENANKYVGILGKDEELKKNRKNVLDDEVLRDPNSAISQQARDIAKKVGLKIGDTVTAKQLADAGLPIGNLLTQKMAIDDRQQRAKEASELKQIMLAEKKQKEAEEQKSDVGKSVDKLTENLRKSKDYEAYSAVQSAKAALDEAILDNNKTKAGSAFMIYAKIAQGDNSVVRESDMKNLAGSFNYSSPGEMLSKLAAKAQGGNFSTEELKQMRIVADTIGGIKAKQVKSQLIPIENRISKAGLPMEEYIDPALIRQFKDINTEAAPGLTTISKKTVSLPGQQAPGTVINQKSTGKKFKVNADGITATEI